MCELIYPYIQIKILGKGQEGIVVLAFDKKHNRHVAIKQIQKQPLLLKLKQKTIALNLKEVEQLYIQQVEFLKKLNTFHLSYFPTLYQTFETENCWNIVLEYISGESLRNILPKLSTSCHSYEIIYQILDIFQIFTKHNLIYLDFNLANFIVSKNYTIHLIDYGLTCILGSSCESNLIQKIYGNSISIRNMLVKLYAFISTVIPLPRNCDYQNLQELKYDIIEEMFPNYRFDFLETNQTFKNLTQQEYITFIQLLKTKIYNFIKHD